MAGTPDADLNGDGVVSTSDLLILLTCQGRAKGACAAADLDGNGAIGAGDLVILITSWGPAI